VRPFGPSSLPISPLDECLDGPAISISFHLSPFENRRSKTIGVGLAIRLPYSPARTGQAEIQRSSGEGGRMDTANSGKGIICRGIDVEEPVSEQKIWVAVLLQAVDDWRSTNLKLRRDAEQFLFREKNDFDVVCAGAGIESSSFRSRLVRAQHLRGAVSEGSSRIAA
jgi:hypothetical protein